MSRTDEFIATWQRLSKRDKRKSIVAGCLCAWAIALSVSNVQAVWGAVGCCLCAAAQVLVKCWLTAGNWPRHHAL
jgi:hypothetical protein